MAEGSDNQDYDSDEILSQALDMFEGRYDEEENDKIFITQSNFRDVPEEEVPTIYDTLLNAVDVSDMLLPGGATTVAGERFPKIEAGRLVFSTFNIEYRRKYIFILEKQVWDQNYNVRFLKHCP